MTAAQVLAFAGVVMLGAMSPGPDFAVVVRHAIVSGRARGMLAGAGVAAGVLLWALIAVATLVGAFRRLLARPAVRRGIDAVSGAVLIGLGVRLAVTSAR